MIKYNPEISLGSIAETLSVVITIGALAVAVGNKLATHETLLATHDKEFVRVQKEIEKVASDTVANDALIRSEIRDVHADVREIDRKVTGLLISGHTNAANRASAR